jgi:fumarate hydratase class II
LKKDSNEFMQFFPLSQIQSGWWTSTNMLINEVLANEASLVLWAKYGSGKVDAHNHLNTSQSSNDTFPWVTKIACLKLIVHLRSGLKSLEKEMKSHARKRRNIKKVWRTHLQDAVVVRLWDDFSAYARTINKNISYLDQARKTLLELNFGGTATWSLQNITTPIRKELVREFSKFYARDFIQPKSYFEQNSSSWDLAFFSQTLTHIANDIIKIWNDMRLMSSWPLAWFNEYDLPVVQPWSSIMPWKVNPSVIEALTMVCAKIVWADQTVQILTRNAQLQLQQFMPGIAFALITSLHELSWSIEMFVTSCVKGITPNKKHITELLNWSFAHATDYSESLWYEVVADAVVKALKTWKSLKEILDWIK